jgi:hypothetical protein
VTCGSDHIQCNYSSVYLGFSILLKVSVLLLEISRQLNARYSENLMPNIAHIIQFTLCETVVPTIYNVITAQHIQASIFNCSYLRCYSRYLDNSMCVILQTWCQIQRTSSSLRYLNCCPVHIQCNYSSTHCWLQYSSERICAAIGGIPTFRCGLYCKPGAKYCAHPPVYDMWTVVPTIYNVITAPLI